MPHGTTTCRERVSEMEICSMFENFSFSAKTLVYKMTEAKRKDVGGEKKMEKWLVPFLYFFQTLRRRQRCRKIIHQF